MVQRRRAETVEEDKRTLFRAALAHFEQFVSYAEDVASYPKNYDLKTLTTKAKQCRGFLNRLWKVV